MVDQQTPAWAKPAPPMSPENAAKMKELYPDDTPADDAAPSWASKAPAWAKKPEVPKWAKTEDTSLTGTTKRRFKEAVESRPETQGVIKGEAPGDAVRRMMKDAVPGTEKAMGAGFSAVTAPLGAAGEVVERKVATAAGVPPNKIDKISKDTGDVTQALGMVLPGGEGKAKPIASAAKETAEGLATGPKHVDIPGEGKTKGLTPFGEKEKQRTFQSKIFSPDAPIASTKPVSSVEGVADKLYQQRGAIRADYKDFTKWATQFKGIPQEFWQKALDHLDDPKGVPLSAEEKLIFDRSIGTMRDEIDANRAEIKASGFDPEYLETESEGLGGAIRQRKGVGTPMDRLTGEKIAGKGHNMPPGVEGGRILSRTAGTFKSRNMMALIKDGKRTVVHVDDEGNVFDASQQGGDPLGHLDKETGDFQGQGKLGEATRKEIESATKGEIKYHDNAFGVYATSLLQTRRALRSVRILNDIKKSPEFNEVARAPYTKAKDIPDGWREIPDSPEFKGYKFEPHYAEEIEDFIKGTQRDAGVISKIDKINRFTLSTLFWLNPIHAYNITDAFAVTKGAGAALRDAPSLTTDLLKSIKSIATRDKYAMQQARAGVPMPGLDTAGEEFRRMTLDVMAVKTRQDPRSMAQFAKEFGFDKPVDFFKKVSELSHKAVFSWQDVLQQTLERQLMRKGMTQAQATEEIAKTFMNYRTPARVADQRWMGKALQGQAWLDFPKYSYGRLKGVVNMAKGAAKGNPHAIDQLLTIALLYEFGQHVLNPLIQQITGKKNAEFGDYGYTVIPALAEKTMEGKRTIGQDVQSLLSPGYAVQAGSLAAGVNPFLGKPISIPGESAKEVGFDYANELANKISPLQRMGQVSSGRLTPEDLWLEQMGVKFPAEMPKSVIKQLKAREKYGNTLQNELGQ